MFFNISYCFPNRHKKEATKLKSDKNQSATAATKGVFLRVTSQEIPMFWFWIKINKNEKRENKKAKNN